MDIAWLAGIGVLLLVVGLSALGYDTVRRRHEHHPFPFPDSATSLLDDTAIQTLIAQPTTSTGGLRPPLPRLLDRLPRPRAKIAALPRISLSTLIHAATSARVLTVLACCALAAAGLGFAVYQAASEPAAAPAGSLVVAVCPFANEPPKSPTGSLLAGELTKSAVQSGIDNLLVRQCSERPASPEDAERERARLKAGLLLWGEVGPTGDMTATLFIAHEFSAAGASWQQWGAHEPDTLLLPVRITLRLPGSAGVDPLVPLVVSLSDLLSGDYSAAARAAGGAQATIDQISGSGEAGDFVQGVALAASGDLTEAMRLFSRASLDPDMAPESITNRAFVRLAGGDSAGARSDLDRLIGERDTPDRVLARAHLLRARAYYRLANDYASALPELDESLRLDPTFTHSRLDKAEVLYRLSQPDAALAELTALARNVPDAAPAYRQMGLVWLMLDRPEDAQNSLGQAKEIYARWIAGLRAEEGKAQVTGDLEAANRATDGIVALNRELARVQLYSGMALADYGRKQPPEGFLATVWRRIRSEPSTYERAAAAMQEAARLDPRSPDIPLQMGSVYSTIGDDARAAQAFRQAQDLDPAAPEPYLSLARLQESQGSATEAAKTLNDLIARSPGAYQPYQQLHDIFARAGDAASARASLERALSVAPQTPQDHLWHGRFLHALGRNNEALGELQTASSDPALWEAHSLTGHILMDAGQGPDALAQFQAVLVAQPNDPDSLLNAGRLLLLAGQTSQAEDMLKRLTSTTPGNADGHELYLQVLLGKGDVDGAVAQGRQAVQADGKRADAYYYLGTAYEAKRDWTSASAQFQAATERDPKSFDAFLRWAETLYHEDGYGEAIAAADSVIKLRGNDPAPYRWKAEAQLALREPNDALKSAGQALAISPESADALALASRAYSLKGDAASAVSYARKAISAEPRNPAGQLALGEATLAGGRNAEALEAFASAADVDAKSVEAVVGEGRAYSAMGDKDRALGLYRDAAGLGGDDAAAHLYSGHTYVDLGRWDQALREYARAAQIRPRWPEAQYYLGRAYLQRKDLPTAQRNFSSATQYEPNLVEAWFGLGITDRELGQTSEAISALTQAVKLNQNYADAWLYLGLCYEESGDRPSAAKAFANASNTAQDPAIKQQADQGLGRLK